MKPIASRTPGMKEIVGILTKDNKITNSPSDVLRATAEDMVKIFLDRTWMELMATMDLGSHWNTMASGPTLFSVNWETGEVAPGIISWRLEKMEVGE